MRSRHTRGSELAIRFLRSRGRARQHSTNSPAALPRVVVLPPHLGIKQLAKNGRVERLAGVPRPAALDAGVGDDEPRRPKNFVVEMQFPGTADA